MKGFIFVFLLIAILVLGDDVVEFSDSDFENKISDHDAVLVMFYAPWCGHCKKLKPEFEKAASLLKVYDPPVTLAKVDCTESGKDTCQKFGVSGYPTLKIFKSGSFSSEYNGPREYNGIVKYMRAQVGPVSKVLSSVTDAEEFLSKNEVGVVCFCEDSTLKEAFLKVADKLRETIRFAHSINADVNEKYSYTEAIVLFRPKHLDNKFEQGEVKFEGKVNKDDIEVFIKDNYHGIVGHRTQENVQNFRHPLVIAYYGVDYVKNMKGTNYWRNRILKIAQNYIKDFTFAISSNDDFQHELNEFGIEYAAGDKPVVCARDDASRKFVMKEEFSMETFEEFLEQLKAGELEPYLKSEAIPESQDGSVTVAVGKNFDDVVTNSGKDALVEFYAPWCGHCKKLAPIYDELGNEMKKENVAIVKMDATANDVPSSYNVRGFPTLYWKPKSSDPVQYNGGRELDDFIKYIAKHSTEELNGWDRNGVARKSEL